MFGSTSTQPKYIPEYADKLTGIDILTPAQANVSGEGTSDVTLKRDFEALADYLCAITGGCKENSIVTTDGTYNFGNQYFFNSNNKCTLESDENVKYCDPNAKVNDSVYQYIYVNTKSDGLLRGMLTDVTNMAKIPVKMVEVLAGATGSKCKCVTLQVSGEQGGERCAGAFISSTDANDPEIMKNKCVNNIMDTIYNIKTTSDSTTSPMSSFGFGKSGFTTMYINQKDNIEFAFFVLVSILMIFIFYKLI